MMTDKTYEMFSDYEDVVTVDDVMKMLHIGKNSVYDLLKNHRIESIRVMFESLLCYSIYTAGFHPNERRHFEKHN